MLGTYEPLCGELSSFNSGKTSAPLMNEKIAPVSTRVDEMYSAILRALMNDGPRSSGRNVLEFSSCSAFEGSKESKELGIAEVGATPRKAPKRRPLTGMEDRKETICRGKP
jgi:hypothetical protein